MRRFLALILIITTGLIPIAAAAGKSNKSKPPFVMAFSSSVGADGKASSSELVVTVVEQLRNLGKAEVIVFNPELPNVARAVLEHRLTKELVDKSSEPQNAVEIAKLLGADYALCIKGSAVTNKATMTLDMSKVPSGGTWSTTAESDIAVGSGPRESVNRSNAISTAASSAVSQIIIQAFGQASLMSPSKPAPEPPAVKPEETVTPPAKEEAPAATPAETPAAAPETPAATATPDAAKPQQTATEQEPARDPVAEYNQVMKTVEAYEAKKDLRNAIVELKKAVNLDPDKATARVRLAEMYTQLGMTAEAADECKRALMFGKDSVSVHNMLAKLYMSSGSFAEAADECKEVIRLDPKNTDVRLTLGDIYWNQAKVDDATSVYEEAVSVDPKNVTAHDRLQRLYSARKMYDKALAHMIQIKVPSPDVQPDSAKRYTVLAQVIQDEFASVMGKLDSARQDFDQGKLAREDYYRECKDATGEIEALASYLSTQTAPEAYKKAHPHGVLATSLLAQASGCVVSFLETEKQYYMEQFSLLQNEAKTELGLYQQAFPKS